MKTKNTMLINLFLHNLYNYKFGLKYSTRVEEVYKYLLYTMNLTPSELETLKFNKLKKLLIHAYENVPYYKDLMDRENFNPYDFDKFLQFFRIPPLTKNDIKENFDKLQTSNFKGKFFMFTTGGSTGEPVKIYRDLNSIIWTEAAYWRGILDWAGCKLLDKQVILLTFGKPTFLGKIRQLLINNYVFESFKINADLVRKIKRLAPRCIMSYASNMYEFALLVDQAKEYINIPLIFTTGEMLFDYQRDFIEKKLNGKVFDYYGCNEVGSLAFEFNGKKFVTDEHVILEAVDENFNPQTSEKVGKFLLTDLDNYVMPIIRYENGDFGSISPPRVRPKTIPNLTLINKLEGRRQEFIINNSGEKFSVVYVTSVLSSLETIKKFQIIQNNYKKVTFKYVPSANNISGRDKEVIEREFKKMLGKDVVLKFEKVTELPKTRRGKTRVIVSELIR